MSGSRGGVSFNIARFLGGIAKSVAQLFDGVIQTRVEINKTVGGPELLAEFLAGYQVAGMLQQKRKHLEGWSCSFRRMPCL